MAPTEPSTFDAGTTVWRLAVTLFFVLLNGYFVAAEFAFVKVRSSRIAALAQSGNMSAVVARSILKRLDLYLSSCQFGITVSSLILGWLAEPAVAELLIFGAHAAGWPLAHSGPLHIIALAIALTVITMLHMTLGEQAPKIWAIQRAETAALLVARPLKLFTFVFGPLIALINAISNWMLRRVGISSEGEHEVSLSVDELRSTLAASAQAGTISPRQRELADNILGFIHLQVRHILVPRVDVVSISAGDPIEDSLKAIRESRHSRLPLCENDLDDVIGIVHTKDVMGALSEGKTPDLRALARDALYIPDTQPLGRMILELQRAKVKSALVLDDRGTVIGMAFLEDSLEEIVGPIEDEFDEEEPSVTRPDDHAIEMRGDLPFPDASAVLGLDEAGTDDTIGGHIVSVLKRLPVEGDQLKLGGYDVTIVEVSNRRIERLRFEPPAAGLHDEA